MLAPTFVKTPRRFGPHALLAAAAMMLVGFSVICGSVLLSMRQSDDKLALQTLGNLATAIDADIARNVELYDLSLRNVANNMLAPEAAQANPATRQLILFDHAATARHFGAIQVLNAAGTVTLDSTTLDPRPDSYADDEFFKVHKKDPLSDLYISKPLLHNGAYGIILSRRINSRDGGFLGVVAGFIHYSYFHEMVDKLQLEPDDMITVFRRDGLIVMRAPFDMDVIGRDVSKLRGVQKALASFSGSFVGRAANDNIQRLFVWREAYHPLIVMVGRSTKVIFGQWREDAFRISAAMGALSLIASGVMLMLAREMSKRAAIENEMAQLAMTDGLTGLGNRRHFDLVIDKVWREALRDRTPISLLMIDADHFKSFNDRFGHQAGDLVLREIADSIRRHAERARDCAARYGGEEFAVILPGMSLLEAVKLAERIRIHVSGLYRGGNAPTTISVGVACLVPSVDLTATRLIGDADAALYAAKSKGRNRTWPAGSFAENMAA